MITVMDSVRRPVNDNMEKSVDHQLWHACAGGMVQMPAVNSKVFYFPQGHAEHAHKNVDFGQSRLPPLILCRVAAIRYMADKDSDEVFAKLALVPARENEYEFASGIAGLAGFEKDDKPNSFAKTLTQSDANNGGGFSVPRYCAETIFPRLDYSAEPPVQTLLAKDIHGEIWKFRHIYRGTPRRHLLTTGWSNFVNQKKLVSGDSVVFLRAQNGDLCLGIRRAKRGTGSGPEVPTGWNTGSALYGGGLPRLLGEEESRFFRSNGNGNDVGARARGKLTAESIIEAATLAAGGQPFDVVFYPRASTPEFVVRAAAVKAAMRVQWGPGMRFKMPFETEDSSRISWFMGTISSVQVDDSFHWPNSPWRLLQVTWDEPDLLQNVKRVSPWLVELVSTMPSLPTHLSPFSPPRKKMRLPQPPDYPVSISSNPLSPSSPLCCLPDNIMAGIQGARHSQFGLNSFESHLNKLQQAAAGGLFPFKSRMEHHFELSSNNDVSCALTMGNAVQEVKTSADADAKAPAFLLFGQPILTERQISQSSSSNGSGSAVLDSGSDHEGFPWCKDGKNEFGLETGHCKVFMESEDVGRTLDLSVFPTYEGIYRKLAEMFGIEPSEMQNNVLYQNPKGQVKHTGDEPFSEFLKTAKRITILTDSASDNVGRLDARFS